MRPAPSSRARSRKSFTRATSDSTPFSILSDVVQHRRRQQPVFAPLHEAAAKQDGAEGRAQVVRHRGVKVQTPILRAPAFGDVAHGDGGGQVVAHAQRLDHGSQHALADGDVGQDAGALLATHVVGMESGQELAPAAPHQLSGRRAEQGRRLLVGEGDVAGAVQRQQRVGRLGQQGPEPRLRRLELGHQAPGAHQRVDPGPQLGLEVGFGQEIVGSCRKGLHHLLRAAGPGQQQDADAAEQTLWRPYEGTHIYATHTGHDPVQHQHLGSLPGGEPLDDALAVFENDHFVVGRQGPRRALKVERAVVDYPDGAPLGFTHGHERG